MERLVRLAAVLHKAGRDGVSADRLAAIAGFTGGADAGSQLARELRHLRNSGWQIDNVAADGDTGHYVMTSVDSRIRVQLTEAQQAALRRAVLLTDRAGLADRLGLPTGSAPAEVATVLTPEADDAALETVLRAVRERCLLHFRYKGSDRTVHPVSVLAVRQSWHLHCTEDGDDRVKVFVVSRMRDVHADEPGSAHVPSVVRHPSPDPLLWEVHDAIDVTLEADAEFAPDVRDFLGEAAAEETDGEVVRFIYRVTNRAGLRSRVYQLGTRVRLLGPDAVRAEMLDELATMAGE